MDDSYIEEKKIIPPGQARNSLVRVSLFRSRL